MVGVPEVANGRSLEQLRGLWETNNLELVVKVRRELREGMLNTKRGLAETQSAP